MVAAFAQVELPPLTPPLQELLLFWRSSQPVLMAIIESITNIFQFKTFICKTPGISRLGCKQVCLGIPSIIVAHPVCAVDCVKVDLSLVAMSAI